MLSYSPSHLGLLSMKSYSTEVHLGVVAMIYAALVIIFYHCIPLDIRIFDTIFFHVYLFSLSKNMCHKTGYAIYHNFVFFLQMTPKEAFRDLSHKFHGKGPGKMKLEKRQKKYQDDMKAKQMKSSDTPLMSAEKMRDAQARGQTPYLVLSGNAKSGYVHDFTSNSHSPCLLVLLMLLCFLSLDKTFIRLVNLNHDS